MPSLDLFQALKWKHPKKVMVCWMKQCKKNTWVTNPGVSPCFRLIPADAVGGIGRMICVQWPGSGISSTQNEWLGWSKDKHEKKQPFFFAFTTTVGSAKSEWLNFGGLWIGRTSPIDRRLLRPRMCNAEAFFGTGSARRAETPGATSKN